LIDGPKAAKKRWNENRQMVLILENHAVDRQTRVLVRPNAVDERLEVHSHVVRFARPD
jgi:hypothetical protein